MSGLQTDLTSHSKRIDAAVPIFMYLLELGCWSVEGGPLDGYTLEDCFSLWEKWQRLTAADADSPWAGNRHYGDCTNEPVTCTVCLIAYLRQEAEVLLVLAAGAYSRDAWVPVPVRP